MGDGSRPEVAVRDVAIIDPIAAIRVWSKPDALQNRNPPASE